MKRKYLIAAFIVTVLIQLSIPIKMIRDSEITEKEGEEFRFQTVPIDPNDPFRGKYITLEYTISSFATNDTTFHNGDRIFVKLTTDAEGFTQVESVFHEAPKDEKNYVIAEVSHSYGGKIHIDFPFERFYMAEGKAAQAEIAYNEYSRKEKAKATYAVVAVKEGNAVIKDVIIDGLPIKDYVSKNRK